jgi:ubiquinone/menaquinone biosynthesis C-methylase UbiE
MIRKLLFMSTIFNEHYEQYDEWYEKNKCAYLSELEAIKKVLPKRGRGLEIGVGTGRFAQPLGIAIGIDPAKNMVEIAGQRGVDVLVGYGESLPFKNTTFDYVAIIITLCFVKNSLKVLKETRRVLKKHGKVIICIIDKNSFLGKYYQKRKSIFYHKAHFFSAEELTELLKTMGFNTSSYYQTVFTYPDNMNSIEKPQRGFGSGSFVVMMSQKLLKRS